MTLPEVRDIFRSLPSGGNLTDENRFDDNYLDQLIHSVRALSISNKANVMKKRLPIWYQSMIPEYSKDFQDGQKLCVKFQIPDVITLDARENGYGYCGTVECNKAFRIWTDRGVFASACNDRIMNPTSGRTTNILFEGSNYGEIYGATLITELPRFVAIFAIPTDVPTYNILTDQYPIDEGSIEDMINIMTKANLNIITKSFYDRVNQGRVDNAATAPARP
jgi:hypothetical protein